MKFPFQQKAMCPFLMIGDFRSIFQNKEQRHFDRSAKNKNRNTGTERGAKRKDKNDSDELTK